ncbi:MAG TPA: ADP-ribosylglycohydrolase family protein, partial [Albitalea sp.]|nr:ADP-ribosylglycohydrolase family protein [Albitalea sp.]
HPAALGTPHRNYGIRRGGDLMLGSVIGDVIGSRFETQTMIDQPVSLLAPECGFTDDSVCVAAVADSLVHGRPLHACFQDWVLRYPTAEYGAKFKAWAVAAEGPAYGSIGNGGAMRVSPAAILGADLCEVVSLATRATSVSHNHPDAVGAAVLLAETIHIALRGASPADVRQHIASRGARLQPVSAYRDLAHFTTDASATIGQALSAATSATSFEEAMRHCIAVGGDTDTICCMAGGLAEALFGLPNDLVDRALPFLPEDVVHVLGALYSKAGRGTLGLRTQGSPKPAVSWKQRRSLFKRFHFPFP